jgi:hypothetical protein
VWRSEDFAAELRGFVTGAVGPPTILEPLKVRPWSTVWRVEAGGRAYFVKQNCPGQAHEARLVAVLGKIAPEYVVPVVAADADRDLLLTSDLGPTLRAAGAGGDVDAWCRITSDAAALQRRVVHHIAELPLSLMEADDATTYVADAVGRLAALAPEDPRRLDPRTAAELEALLPTIELWADQVTALDLPIALNHNDLHDNNVIATAGGPLRFFDFGDAVLTEPLGALLVPLAALAEELGAGPDDPRLCRVADAALEVWSDGPSMSELRAALPAALQLGRLARIEAWRRCVASMTPEEIAEFGPSVPGWLGSLLADPPVGRAARM